MPDHIDTRDGWRRAPIEMLPETRTRHLVEFDGDDQPLRMWVREEPVPPLPTEPYTVIRVTWRENVVHLSDDELTLHVDGWRDSANGALGYGALESRITGFEVLAEPRTSLDRHRAESAASVRRETAKAVLDQVRERIGRGAHAGFVDTIAREFGVES